MKFDLDFEIQDGPGTEPEPETGTVGTVFPETEGGTETVETVFAMLGRCTLLQPPVVETDFQEPKPELEPSLSVKTVLKQKKKVSREGTVRTENRNCSNRPMHKP